MLEKELKIRFDSGSLKAASVTPAFMVEGWSLVIKDSAGNDHAVTLKRGGERVFKSIDAACALAREIGFSTAKVVLRN
tara:strand:+ start:6201 stop:6434 length:234 start_codon:yes stop_codon:yes gene_type:complete